MKKFLLFVMLTGLLSLSTYSQSLVLHGPDGPIANNSNVVLTGIPTSPDITCYLYVGNTSASSASVLLKKVIIDTVTGSINSFCWGTNCYPPFVYISPEIVDIPAGSTDSVSFSGHYEPLGFSGTSIVRYVFYLSNNVNDSVCVNAYFMAFPLGIDQIVAKPVLSAAYPNPATTHFSFDYSVPEGAVASVIVRDVLGSIKYQASISKSGKLTLNTSDFQNGIYFFSLQVNGKSEMTKKIIVQH